MKKKCKNSEEKNLLPFHIIKAASEGNVMAINAVLKLSLIHILGMMIF